MSDSTDSELTNYSDIEEEEDSIWTHVDGIYTTIEYYAWGGYPPLQSINDFFIWRSQVNSYLNTHGGSLLYDYIYGEISPIKIPDDKLDSILRRFLSAAVSFHIMDSIQKNEKTAKEIWNELTERYMNSQT